MGPLKEWLARPRLKEWLWGIVACVFGAAAGFATAHGADLPAGWGAVIAALFAAIADGLRHFYEHATDVPLSETPTPPSPSDLPRVPLP